MMVMMMMINQLIHQSIQKVLAQRCGQHGTNNKS